MGVGERIKAGLTAAELAAYSPAFLSYGWLFRGVLIGAVLGMVTGVLYAVLVRRARGADIFK